MSKLRLNFIPREDGTIRCERIFRSGINADDIIYRKDGLRPYYKSLTPEQQVSWDQAVDVVGWGSEYKGEEK